MSDRDRLLHGKASVFEEIGHELRGVRGLPDRLDADPEKLERGLAQLVLTVIELLRQLMELQALRRVESGRLSDEEVERLGQSLKALDAANDAAHTRVSDSSATTSTSTSAHWET